jgi:hypothetical protein
VAVTLVGGLEASALPPMTERAVYRAVQEALTNATKHAPGAPVTVTLRTEVDQVVASVVNKAPPATASSDPASGGSGLVSLDERVRLAGGTLGARPVDGGFAVTARLPLSAGAAATPPGGLGASRRELALRRSRVRRSMIDAIWVPAAVVVLVLMALAYDRYTASGSVLDRAVYAQLRIGEPRSAVENRLPTDEAALPRGRPADPPGTDECRVYRTSAWTLERAYRLCFTGDRLSRKHTLSIGE